MYFSNHFHKAFINLAGNVKETGTSADLAPGQLGFADAKTWNLVSVATASVTTHPLVVLCQGSLYQNDKVTEFHGGYAESIKSRPINGRYITRFTKHAAVTELPHVVQIGYNGATDCVCPEFEENKYYNLRVEVKGSPVLRAYTRNLYRVFGVYTGCEFEADEDGIVDPAQVFTKFAEQIKNDPQVSDFLKEVRVVIQGNTSISGTAIKIWRASRCDTGDIVAFGEVAAAYSGIKFYSRSDTDTTYELQQAATPTNNVASTGLTWSQVDVKWKSTKKICLTLPKKSDGSSNLTDVQTSYTSDTKFVASSILAYDQGTTTTTSSTTSTTSSTTTLVGDTHAGCTEIIQASIYSDNLLDIDCEAEDLAVFSMPRSYNGYDWEECPCDETVEDVSQCVGLRLKAKTSAELTDKFSNCSYDQMDHVETEPVTIIVSFVNEFGETCDFQSLPVTEIQRPVIAQGLGEFALRELILSSYYAQDFFLTDPRMREVIQYPYLQAIDRNKTYTKYVLAHTIPTGIGPSGTIGQDRFLYNIYLETGLSATTFETWMAAYLTSAGTGVSLETL